MDTAPRNTCVAPSTQLKLSLEAPLNYSSCEADLKPC
jgi:hypothetical protein